MKMEELFLFCSQETRTGTTSLAHTAIEHENVSVNCFSARHRLQGRVSFRKCADEQEPKFA
jgi:hypothetical protein